jgi:hypothetical protein
MRIVTFKVDTKELKSALRKMKPAFSGLNTKMRKKSVCEVTVKTHQIELVVTGIQYIILAESSGAAKIVFQFFPFLKLLDSYHESTLEFKISDGIVELGNFSIPAKTTFIENDSILRSIILPMNYKDKDLLHLLIKGYTKEELEFNHITPAIEKARNNLISNSNKAFESLKQYGVTHEDLKKLVTLRLGVDLFKDE